MRGAKRRQRCRDHGTTRRTRAGHAQDTRRTLAGHSQDTRRTRVRETMTLTFNDDILSGLLFGACVRACCCFVVSLFVSCFYFLLIII